MVGLPALIWAEVGGQSYIEAFAWRKASRVEILGACMIGLGLLPCLIGLFTLQSYFWPDHAASNTTHAGSWIRGHPWSAALIVSPSAAIFEEMLFRGVLQRALLRRFPAFQALFIGSFLFAASHFDAHGLLSRTILGLVLGWIVLRGGSLFPAIAIHSLYNSVLFILPDVFAPSFVSKVDITTANYINDFNILYFSLYLLVGLLLLMNGVWLLLSKYYRKVYDE